MKLKIASITNLTDARFFSAVGADYLGFCFDVLHKDNIGISNAKEIIQWLHEPTVVGEFGAHQTKEEIEFIAQQMDLHEIQIPFEHPQKDDLNFEKFLTMDSTLIVDSQQSADFFVLRINSKDIGNPDLKSFICSHKVFIETDFTKENIQIISETLQPYGIQIACKKEEKTGLGFADEYAEMLEKIGFS